MTRPVDDYYVAFCSDVIRELRECARVGMTGAEPTLRALGVHRIEGLITLANERALEDLRLCWENYQSVSDSADLLRDLYGNG